MESTQDILEKIKVFLPYLDEHQKRVYLASGVKGLG
jgi:hypothetical protein